MLPICRKLRPQLDYLGSRLDPAASCDFVFWDTVHSRLHPKSVARETERPPLTVMNRLMTRKTRGKVAVALWYDTQNAKREVVC